MKQNKDMRIGEIRYIRSIGEYVECKRGMNCGECAFQVVTGCNNAYCEETGECSADDRADGIDVYYEVQSQISHEDEEN